MSPGVSIVILNWNGLQDTLGCLESLQKTTYSDYDVVVIDNASEGNDVALLRERFRDYIHLIENDKNYGFSEGCNIGVRYAIRRFDPDYIALLNNDTTVHPEWLTELIAPLAADSSGTLGATCSLIRDISCPERIQYGGDAKMNIFGQCKASTIMELDTAVRTLAGACCLIKRSALDDLGTLFCSEFFIYYNDIDLSWRLNSLGYGMRYVPTSVVCHKEAASARTAPIRERNAILNTRNKYLTFYRNLSLPKFMAMFPVLLAYDTAIMIAWTIYKSDPLVFVTKARGILESFRMARQVQHIGGGRLRYLDTRLYLDKLG